MYCTAIINFEEFNFRRWSKLRKIFEYNPLYGTCWCIPGTPKITSHMMWNVCSRSTYSCTYFISLTRADARPIPSDKHYFTIQLSITTFEHFAAEVTAFECFALGTSWDIIKLVVAMKFTALLYRRFSNWRAKLISLDFDAHIYFCTGEFNHSVFSGYGEPTHLSDIRWV